MSDSIVRKKKIKRKPSISISGFKYRSARLVHPDDLNLKSDWYIVFYVSDTFNEKLHRKRVLKEELGAISTPEARFKYAEEAIHEINKLLHNDWVTTETDKNEVVTFNFKHFSLLKAIKYVAGIKLKVEGVKPRTIREYTSTATTIEEFFQHEKISLEYSVQNVNQTFLRRYFDYLKEVRESSNKTYNNRRIILHSVFSTLIDRDKSLFRGVNPVSKIKMLKTETKKHASYSDAQMIRIKEAILKGNQPNLVLFIQFMYFSLARPDELRFLKVGDINMQDRKILFRSENAKTSIEEYVGINDSFARGIEESGILKFPENYYVFSIDSGRAEPGFKPVGKNYFYKNIKPYISALGYLKLNPNHTVYSFKHTGAIALYKATRDIKLVQAQCRHKNIEQTNTYLRDLGVLNDFEQLNKWKSPI